MDELVVISLNHHTAPVAVREKFASNKDSAQNMALQLRELGAAEELVILSTCNRFEIYAANANTNKILNLLSLHSGVPQGDITPYLTIKSGTNVPKHLFRVAAGLDSVVLGEDQIIGQVAKALQQAQTQKTSGRILNTLFQHAIASGKRVRSETGLGEGAFSVGRVAVDFAREKLGDLKDLSVLILGAGKISELSAKHLAANGVQPIFVANRTHTHADDLAKRIGGKAIYFEDLRAHLVHVDIVLSSTAAPHYVLHTAIVAEAMLQRPNRPLLLIDLAVPRDIEPSVATLSNVTLHNVDDLKFVQAEKFRKRQNEIPKAEAILDESFEKFQLQAAGLHASGVIKALHGKLEHIRLSELEKISHILNTLSPEQREAVNRVTEIIGSKFLHEPTVQIKEMHLREKSILNTVCDLFRLPATHSPLSCAQRNHEIASKKS